MLDRELIDRKMQSHYVAVWRSGDAWEFESSDDEQARFAAQLAMLAGNRLRLGLLYRELTNAALVD